MTTSQAWICTVCGYVHEGPEAPDVCVVCGATQDLFEPHKKTPVAQEVTTAWRCTVCGYIHEDPEAPASCPICAATADLFEPTVASATPAALHPHPLSKQQVIIAGAGIAGVAAAEAIRKADPEIGITLLSKESELPYYRLNLTRYLAGEVDAQSLILHKEAWYQERDIELVCDAELCAIAPQQKQVHLREGEDLAYHQLVLAIGSHPFVPPFPGAQRDNVFTLRTKRDADRILSECQAGRHCVIVGGGLLGLETAGALVRHGVEVTVLEGFDWLLPRQLNATAGKVLEQKVRILGIDVKLGTSVKEICGDQRIREILLKEDQALPAELAVISTGVRANSYIARLAGMEVNQGIVVDNHMRTSHPAIFAAGDVVEHHGMSYGTWGPASLQGRTAGCNAMGESLEFGDPPRSNMLKVLGYDMFSIGRIKPEDGSDLTVEFYDGDNYTFFLFRDSHLVGSILLGNTKRSVQVKVAIEQRRDCSKLVKGKPTGLDVLDFLASSRSGQ